MVKIRDVTIFENTPENIASMSDLSLEDCQMAEPCMVVVDGEDRIVTRPGVQQEGGGLPGAPSAGKPC